MTDPAQRPAGRRLDRVLARTPLVDGHNDLAWAARELVCYDWDDLDLARHQERVQTDLPRLRRGRVGAQFWSVYAPGTLTPGAALRVTLEQIDAVREMNRRYAADLALARSAAQVREIVAGGRIAGLLGAEGGQCLGDSLAVLRTLRRLGVAYLTLTHNESLSWADAAADEPRCGGLSAFGQDVVAEMNRIGMLVDLSHTAADTMRAALDRTTAPVAFSHSCARSVVDHPRNVPDDVLRRLAGNGGVCMVAFVSWFVNGDAAAHRLRGEPGPLPPATVADVVAQVEHVRDVAGIDHVGLGADYDGTPDLPVGLGNVSGYPVLLEALMNRGWSDDDLAKLCGFNILRVLDDVQTVADPAWR